MAGSKRRELIAIVTGIVLALTGPSLAVDSYAGTLPGLKLAREHIAAENYAEAVAVLQAITWARPLDADAFTLLGYSLRKSGAFDEALTAYQRALKISPQHLGANEYLGELYAEMGEIDKALQQLSAIESICGRNCAEYAELDALITPEP